MPKRIQPLNRRLITIILKKINIFMNTFNSNKWAFGFTRILPIFINKMFCLEINNYEEIN